MRALVTGATGFLGGALTRRLHNINWAVTGLGRNRAALEVLQKSGIQTVPADLSDGSADFSAWEGMEIVFHCAALPAPWGRAEDFYRANVLATQNVLHACVEHHVGRLVYVSTPSIYFALRSRLNVREDDPLPARPANEYARTKLMAEKLVDQASAAGLPVVTIRPRAIFGPGDTTILPRLIERLQRGGVPVIGNGKNISDLSYVENVVDALILCAASPAYTLGKKYNISNGDPVVLWEKIRVLCMELGLKYPKRSLAYPIADILAWGYERIFKLFALAGEPPLTRYSVALLAKSTSLDISAARRELGYRPRISVDEGFGYFVDWWKQGHSSGQINFS